MLKKIILTLSFIILSSPSLLYAVEDTPIPLDANSPAVSNNQSADGYTYKTLVNIPGLGDEVTIAPGSLAVYLQTIFNYVIGAAIALAVVMIIYGGVVYATTDAAGKKEEGKTIVTDALYGLALALGSYLILNTINPELLNFDLDVGKLNRVSVATGTVVAVDRLLVQAESSIANGGPVNVGSITVGSGGCAPASIQASAQRGGYNLTTAQANVFSCIAKFESACGRNTSVPKTVSGQQTSARGMFQVVLGLPDKCHSLNIPICTAAARSVGYQVPGNSLNCSQHFRRGRSNGGEGARACQAAAANLDCNASAAACLLARSPSFSDWTADPRASNQIACIRTLNR